MIPAPFEYKRAGSAEEALSLLGQHGDEAKLLAGGQSLLPLMKLRLAMPEILIDVRRISELSYVREDGDEIAIGALTRHADLQNDQVAQRAVPMLAHVAGLVGDPQIRHRGTIGGSCAHADPSADLPTALLAMGATFVMRGQSGERSVPATEFFEAFLETALEPDEMLTEIRVPKAAQGWAYQKFTRRAIDWATVAVAVQIGSDGRTGVALANMGATPLRASAVEEALGGGASTADAAAHADEGTSPGNDVTASAEYRRHLARVLTERALAQAAGASPA